MRGPGRCPKKSSPTPLLGHRLPVTALALSARGLDNDLGKSHDMDMDITWTECKMWLSIGQMCGMVKKNIDIDLKVLFEDNSDTSKYLFMADCRNVHIDRVLDNRKGAFLTHVVNFEANGPNQL